MATTSIPISHGINPKDQQPEQRNGKTIDNHLCAFTDRLPYNRYILPDKSLLKSSLLLFLVWKNSIVDK